MEHMHDNDTAKHPKQDFQVERLAFFSDAVFAIAITLLIIEFKIPHITKDTTYEQVWEQLLELKVSLLALVMSYLLISSYWMRHHFLYKYIHNYNKQIVVVNMLALFPIIFLPFTTAFLAESATNEHAIILGFQVFFLNHFLAGTSIYALYWFGMIRHKHLSYDIPPAEKIKFYEQTLFTSLIFVVLFIATLFTQSLNTVTAVMVVCLLVRFVVIRLMKGRLKAGQKL